MNCNQFVVIASCVVSAYRDVVCAFIWIGLNELVSGIDTGRKFIL